jgi:Asp-tRNA(Asn)/Glu-tRNA(Gln) amidotransferase A subunit family amidase
MARSVADLAKLLDSMVGYDSEDPVTAFGVGKAPPSYAALLDKTALQGARVGILREPMGFRTTPGTDDFNQITAVFDKAVADLASAGAEIVDPITIPDLNALLAKRARSDQADAEGFRLFMARNAKPPYASRQDVMASPLFEQITKGARDRWRKTYTETEDHEYLQARDTLMTRLHKVMADHRLDAIVHKAVEHQPTLIEDGIKPPYVDQTGAPHINTFLVFVPSVVVPAGFTRDNLPAGITFLGRPYDDANMLRFAYAYEQATKHRKPPATTP